MAAERRAVFTVTLTRTLNGDRERVFDALADFTSWKLYMPPAFRPLRGPKRRLRSGDRVLVMLDTGLVRLPTAIKLVRVAAPSQIAWTGGGGLLGAEHRFSFESAGEGKTVVRSEEDWLGALTRIPPLARRVRRQAEIVDAAQLGALADFIERAPG